MINRTLQEVTEALVLHFNPWEIAYGLAQACQLQATKELRNKDGNPRAWRAVATEFNRVKGANINFKEPAEIPFPFVRKPRNENEIVALITELWLNHANKEILAHQGKAVLMADLIQLIAFHTGAATIDRSDPDQPVLTLTRLKE